MKVIVFIIGTVFMVIGIVGLGIGMASAEVIFAITHLTDIAGITTMVIVMKLVGMVFASTGFIFWVYAVLPSHSKADYYEYEDDL